MRILGISGSVRADSHNARLLRAAQQAAPEGVELELLDRLALKSVPPFDEDDEPAPGVEVQTFRDAIRSADAILIATPEYNSSIPGVLKNALDWASRPRADAALAGKTVAVVGASPSQFGAVWAQAELRKVLGASGARVLEDGLAIGGAHDVIDADGALGDPAQAERLSEIIEALVAEAAPRREAELVAA